MRCYRSFGKIELFRLRNQHCSSTKVILFTRSVAKLKNDFRQSSHDILNFFLFLDRVQPVVYDFPKCCTVGTLSARTFVSQREIVAITIVCKRIWSIVYVGILLFNVRVPRNEKIETTVINMYHGGTNISLNFVFFLGSNKIQIRKMIWIFWRSWTKFSLQ